MSLRSRLSPVFMHEAIAGSRRWQGYALRSLPVLAMLIALGIAKSFADSQALVFASIGPRRYLAELGRAFYLGVAGIQISLALLAAPALTAGAVCIDRARGCLEHMFVTHLSNAEIILGKLAARLVAILAFLLAGIPVLAIALLMGGIIPEAVVILTVVTLAVCLLGSSLAMLLSVRAEKPHEVLMAVFAVWAVWLLGLIFWYGLADSGLAPDPPKWFANLNPYVLVYAPYLRPGRVGAADVALFAGLCVLVSSALLLAAIQQVRRQPARLGERSARLEALRRFARRHLFSRWPSPALDGNPVLWREWHRNRPSRMMHVVLALFVLLTTIGMAIALARAVRDGVHAGGSLVGVNVLAVLGGLLYLSATAPTALTEERVRGSLDVLMTTPLPTHRIVLGKWWAAYRRMLPLLVLPALTGLFVASAATDWYPYIPARMIRSFIPIEPIDRVMAAALPAAFLMAHAAAVTSFGLAVATWVKRTGLAVAISVSSFVIGSVSWMFVVDLLVRWLLRNTFGPGALTQERSNLVEAAIQALECLSPMGAQTAPLDTLLGWWNVPRGPRLAVLFVPLALVVVVAAALLGLTLLTFNRCMGRMDERPRRRVAQRPASSRVRTTDVAQAVTLST
jgi:ABC-type transport system involved in multi-copper enzyme maturation permease subunit